MKTLIRPVGLVVTLAAVSLTGLGHAQDKKPADPKKPTVMQRKLAHAQKLLESLAVEDYDKIAKSTEELQFCARDASWRVLKTPKYETFSNDFIRQLDNIQQAAKKKNLDAAALGYVEMTLTCVKCHKYIRDEGIGEPPTALTLVPLPAGE